MRGTLEFIFGLSSLVGLVFSVGFTIFLVANDSAEPHFVALTLCLAIVNLALAIVAVVLFLRVNNLTTESARLAPVLEAKDMEIGNLGQQISKLKNDFGEVSDIIHSIQDQLRDRMFELTDAYAAVESGVLPTSDEIIDIERTNELFYLFLLNNMKSMLDKLTGGNCAVCIKILSPGIEGNRSAILVRTLMRDSMSYRERRGSDKAVYEYPYFNNTAFRVIMSDSPVSYYVCDDLMSSHSYDNANEAWRDYYNATLVCPIRMELIGEKEADRNEYAVLGFLCADNMHGNFDNQVCVQLMASIADGLFNHFLMFTKVRQAAFADVYG